MNIPLLGWNVHWKMAAASYRVVGYLYPENQDSLSDVKGTVAAVENACFEHVQTDIGIVCDRNFDLRPYCRIEAGFAAGNTCK
jgi:hypothetical protein